MRESAYELGRQSVSKKVTEESKTEVNGMKITPGAWQLADRHDNGIKFGAKVYEENS